jgi:hypothetical protein
MEKKLKRRNQQLKETRLNVMIHVHVVVVKNINNVVENKLANPDKIRENASFSLLQKAVFKKSASRYVLDNFFMVK